MHGKRERAAQEAKCRQRELMAALKFRIRRCRLLVFSARRKSILIRMLMLSMLFAVLNSVLMTGRISSRRRVRTEYERATFNKERNAFSRYLQTTAAEAAYKATAKRIEDDTICITTFDRETLPEEERGLLLFSAPPPQLQVLPSTMKSWDDALRGRGKLVVFTNDPQTRKLLREYNIPTVCVEHTDEGLPRLDKMFERMHDSQPEGIVAYVNSDLSVVDFDPLHKFLDSLNSEKLELHLPAELYQPYRPTGRTSEYWFTVSIRIDTSESGERSPHVLGGYDFWAWNTKPGGLPLLPFDVPPFRFPYSTYDNWLLDMIIQSGQRNAIDASAAIEILHRKHKRVGQSKSWSEARKKGLTGVFINWYLAHNEPRTTLAALDEVTPSFKGIHHVWQMGHSVDCPYYVVKDDYGQMSVAKRTYWSNLLEEDLLNTKCIGNTKCKEVATIMTRTHQEESNTDTLPFADEGRPVGSRGAAAAENWRYTMEEQLKQHATKDGFVLLTAVNFAYREHLMNFKCTLERVGMNDHFVIAAMDKQVYKWGVLQGLPIFLTASARRGPYSGDWVASGGDFGSQGFRSITKLKSMAVLEVLNAGYSVVWSDVDITWFVHPFDALAGFMKQDGGIAIQTNAPYIENSNEIALAHDTVPVIISGMHDPAGRRRLNSGLYVAPSNALVRAAFQEIIGHAAKSKLSEQPSFDEILCAREPSERGYSTCTYRSAKNMKLRNSALHVELLDRFQFTNGAVLVGERNRNVFELGRDEFSALTGETLYAAHNNWIMGEDRKKKRQEDAGWWFSDWKFTCLYLGEPGSRKTIDVQQKQQGAGR